MAGTPMYLHFRQVSIGSNDCAQHDLPLPAVEARGAWVAFEFGESSSQRFDQPTIIGFGVISD